MVLFSVLIQELKGREVCKRNEAKCCSKVMARRVGAFLLQPFWAFRYTASLGAEILGHTA